MCSYLSTELFGSLPIFDEVCVKFRQRAKTAPEIGRCASIQFSLRLVAGEPALDIRGEIGDTFCVEFRAVGITGGVWCEDDVVELAQRTSAGSGSSANTSRQAPLIVPCCRARTSAASSTSPPRAVLMSRAPGFICANAASSMRWRVLALSGTCSETMSLSAKSCASDTGATPGISIGR